METHSNSIASILQRENVWGTVVGFLMIGYGTRQIAPILMRFFPELAEHYRDNLYGMESFARLLRYHMEGRLPFEFPVDTLALPEDEVARNAKFIHVAMEGLPKEG